MKVPFNKPLFTGKEDNYLKKVFKNQRVSGDGPFTKKVVDFFKNDYGINKSLLTTSCTASLEMTAILLNIQEGDEIIMPSFTFVSTANAFALRGAKIVFVDVNPETMNIDERKIEAAITDKTKAIVPVHYAGTSCDMNYLMKISADKNIPVIEDAAQAIFSTFDGKNLGSFGEFGTLSFHDTKNLHCGEGGCLFINQESYYQRSEIIREKGTNRASFIRGEIDKYSWVDIGSSYLPSELSAAVLLAQLENYKPHFEKRMKAWNNYTSELTSLFEKVGSLKQVIPEKCQHNAHLFYIIPKDLEESKKLYNALRDNEINASYHYVPLHSSEYGREVGTFSGKDDYTTSHAERLIRLPLFSDISEDQQAFVIENLKKFYK